MADHATSAHVHGSMDIRQHEKTFAGFLRLAVTVACIAIAILVFLALSNS